MPGSLGRYSQSYNSFAGVDMQVMAGGHLLAEIQGLSFTVTREKAPIYTMGSADPRSFSRGKRGIAGSMILMVFDRSALLESLKESAFYMANEYELSPEQERNVNMKAPRVNVFEGNPGADPTAAVGTTFVGADNLNDYNGGFKVAAQPRYHDQILPFDIVLTAFNEYGHGAQMQICNVEIMNCGSGMSIDDITTDESCTFVATAVLPWYRQSYVNPKTGEVFSNVRRYNDRASHGTV